MGEEEEVVNTDRLTGDRTDGQTSGETKKKGEEFPTEKKKPDDDEPLER